MRRMKILIVDDEKYEADLIAKCVDWEREGFTIVGLAQNGAMALERFAAENPDIVFCDINLPVMNGLEMSRCMKEMRANVCIIIVTGCREFEYARQAVDLGVQNYMLKPIQADELLAAAKKARQSLQDIDTVEPEPNEQRSNLIQSAMNYIEGHLSEPRLSLKEIAPAIFVSNSHPSRTFKQEMGEGVTEYIVRRRMELCKELFDTTNLHVNEVAERVGIKDSHYLGRCFKKQTGMSINKYRKRRDSN